MAFGVKLFLAILEDMTNWIIANSDKISDFNEGSVIRTYCEAVGIELEQIYIRTRVGFDKNLLLTPSEIFNFDREGGQKASGEVVYSRAGTSGTKPIPSGSVISTPDGTRFETTADGEITNGNNDSAAIPIEAEDEGTNGNVPANSITVIITPIAGVETVDNSSGTTGGQNIETDSEYNQRFNEFIEGLGKSSNAGLITAAKLITGVRSASTKEHFPPVASFNSTVYIDDGAGNASQALIDEVQDKIDGDGTEGNWGYKAGGVNIRVLAPTKITVAVTVEITDDGTITQPTIEYNVIIAIENYINNLLIGDDCIRNRIREAIMGVAGVSDINLSVPGSNTSAGADQICRSGVISISFL